jgi:hypothetical protein
MLAAVGIHIRLFPGYGEDIITPGLLY